MLIDIDVIQMTTPLTIESTKMPTPEMVIEEPLGIYKRPNKQSIDIDSKSKVSIANGLRKLMDEKLTIVYPVEISPIASIEKQNTNEIYENRRSRMLENENMFLVFPEVNPKVENTESSTATENYKEIIVTPTTNSPSLIATNNTVITEGTTPEIIVEMKTSINDDDINTTKSPKLSFKAKRKYMPLGSRSNTVYSTKAPFKLTTKKPRPLYQRTDSSDILNKRKQLFAGHKNFLKSHTPQNITEDLLLSNKSVSSSTEANQINSSSDNLSSQKNTFKKPLFHPFSRKPKEIATPIKRIDTEINDTVDEDHEKVIETLYKTLASLPLTNTTEISRSLTSTNTNNSKIIRIENQMKEKLSAIVKQMIAIKSNLENGNELKTELSGHDETPSKYRGYRRFRMPNSNANEITTQSTILSSSTLRNSNVIRKRPSSSNTGRTSKSLETTTRIPSTTQPPSRTRNPSRVSLINSKILNKPKSEESRLESANLKEQSKHVGRRISRGLKNFYTPAIHNGKPLSIIGPIPKGFRVLGYESNYGFQLPYY